jgi:hypothetical protein
MKAFHRIVWTNDRLHFHNFHNFQQLINPFKNLQAFIITRILNPFITTHVFNTVKTGCSAENADMRNIDAEGGYADGRGFNVCVAPSSKNQGSVISELRKRL